MKKLTTFIALIALAVSANAQPLLVGHRGSSYGVESSLEALRAGAELGYQYLESDVKVCKGGDFVLSHDDDLTRLGGTKTITGSTLEELQSEVLTQKRGGVTYTGRLASLNEWLDLCNELNVRPLIELKWATGINNNDQSNIPSLIRTIEAKGLRDKCIIMTSMKPCLEYIRKNYPDITLQFLTGQYWANHFDWCVEHGIDVDIQAGYFDKSTVEKFHDKGLKVNMWTTNTADGYRTYGNMGCDFITTDNLDPKTLPELDPEITRPQNTIDFPRTPYDARVKGYYDIIASPGAPFVAEGAIEAVRFAGGKRVALVRKADGSAAVYTEGKADNLIPETLKAVSAIAATSDGRVAIIGAPSDVALDIAVVDIAGTASPLAISMTPADLGLAEGSVAGRSVAVSGPANALRLYVAATEPGGANKIIMVELNAAGKVATAVANSLATLSSNPEPLLAVTPFSRDRLLIGANGTLVLTDFDASMPDGALTIADTLPARIGEVDASAVSFLRYGKKIYVTIVSDGVCRLYDVTDGLALATPVSDDILGNCKLDAAKIASTAMVSDDNESHIYIIGEDGSTGFAIFDGVTMVPPFDIQEFELTKVWLNANTAGNAPEHIDGTNAQQGTAVNGLFYVNDCADKKIYVFDRTGCIGSMPGGAGWGCCRDDKGNIIVRDDKQTDKSHKLIVYAAGSTPDNYGTPLTFDVEVPIEGQTNFINASGDVYGGRGYVYMFPNRSDAANVLFFENGEYLCSRASQGLMLTGSTAAYVIPRGNDTEHWAYQVRTSGIYSYDAAVNSEIIAGRASTSAPSRNSTGGFTRFTLADNDIIVHNSGANYKGGFSVRNLSDESAVIATVTPIGNLGYETGGNYSTFNWLIAEPTDNEYIYNIYQYCPSNGMGLYQLSVKGAAVTDITLGEGNGDAVYYNLSGVRVTPANLRPGLYIKVTGPKAEKVVIR
ncbi:MAG: glycerophosphodiester phosphodiesterase [Muribaculaceae bacterium]